MRDQIERDQVMEASFPSDRPFDISARLSL